MSAIIRNSLVRAARPSATAALGYRAASTHAISNPTLANIEKRWEGLPMQEQAELWMALRDRMKENWTEMTIQEKKAGKSRMPRPALWRSINVDPIPTPAAELGRSSSNRAPTDHDGLGNAN